MTTPADTSRGDGARDPGRSAAARPIMIATAAVGGLVLLTGGASAAFTAVGEAQVGRGFVSAGTSITDVAGVTGVDLDIGDAEVTVAFEDIDEASIDAEGSGADRWRFTRSGDTLVVESPNGYFTPCFGWCDEPRSARVILPDELEGIDLELALGAGAAEVDGAFDAVGVEVGAGRASIAGSARSFEAQVSAGALEADLADVSSASIELSSGRGDVSLTGRAPDEVEADVSVGSLELELPDTAYRVDSDVAAGDLVDGLSTDPASKHRVSVSVAAGEIVLRAGERPAR